jgi:hypothetical protein
MWEEERGAGTAHLQAVGGDPGNDGHFLVYHAAGGTRPVYPAGRDDGRVPAGVAVSEGALTRGEHEGHRAEAGVRVGAEGGLRTPGTQGGGGASAHHPRQGTPGTHRTPRTTRDTPRTWEIQNSHTTPHTTPHPTTHHARHTTHLGDPEFTHHTPHHTPHPTPPRTPHTTTHLGDPEFTHHTPHHTRHTTHHTTHGTSRIHTPPHTPHHTPHHRTTTHHHAPGTSKTRPTR